MDSQPGVELISPWQYLGRKRSSGKADGLLYRLPKDPAANVSS
jgi:hypothetical protein